MTRYLAAWASCIAVMLVPDAVWIGSDCSPTQPMT